MDDILYLEVDEEIPSVIDKLKQQTTEQVVLVVPAGAALLSSVVNVKLLKRAAEKAKKRLGIITTDPIGRHVVGQVGIPILASVKDRRPIESARIAKPADAETADLDLRPTESADEQGVAVHHYGEGSAEPEPIKHGQPKLAASLGFAARPLVETAVKSPAMPKVDPEPEPITPPHHEPVEEPVKIPSYVAASTPQLTGKVRRKGSLRWKLLVGLAIAALLATSGASAYYLPHATVNLTVVTEPYQSTVNVTVDTSKQSISDSTGKTMSGDHVEATGTSTKSVTTTGKKDVGTPASGTVNFSNGLGQSVKLTKGTAMTASGLTFTLSADVTIPAATASVDGSGSVVVNPGTTTGSVGASAPGDAGNLASGTTLTLQGVSSSVQSKVSATAAGAFTGGTSKQVNVVSQTDLDQAKQSATDDATTQAKQSAAGSLTGKTVLDSATRVSVVTETPSAKVGDEGDNVSDALTVKYEAIVFDDAQFRSTVATQLNQSVPAGKMVVLTSADQVTTSATNTDWSAGTLALSSAVTTQLSSEIDTTALTKSLQGKSLSAATGILAKQSAIQQASVDVRPGWFPWLPFRASAIQLHFVQANAQ